MRTKTVVVLGLAGLAGLAGGCGDSGPGAPPDASVPDAGGADALPAVTVPVGTVFPAGTAVRDAYSGGTATVASDGTVTIGVDPHGVVLLEKVGAAASAFDWRDVTVYNAIVDRFENGDTANDGSYGRHKDGQLEVGTWHGGDWKGVTSKLDYLADLGVTALWISPIVEQVHGWVQGGSGDFKHYGYHGYYALDFTRLDQSFGTEDDLRALVDGAHQRGIRVLVDMVMNHPGYATGADLLSYLPSVFADGTGAAFQAYEQTATSHFNEWNNLVNYSSTHWVDWWSPKWIRASFPGFPAPGNDDLTRQITFLPDFVTEGTQAAGVPVFFAQKGVTGVVEEAGATVRQYLVSWHADWVRRFGIDGFRCDTAKNVELGSWRALKDGATSALADWKAHNPSKKLDDAPFWMTGEVFGHGVAKDTYYSDGGFDSLINFSFQAPLTQILLRGANLTDAADSIETLYAGIATALGGDASFGVLSYASSHDTHLTFTAIGNDPGKQRQAGTVLLLAPGGVEIFYGDESGRLVGPAASDAVQGTRSDMNWTTTDASILEHWKKLGAFRKKHAAIGGGSHQKLDSPAGSYAFARTLGDDSVVVILAAP